MGVQPVSDPGYIECTYNVTTTGMAISLWRATFSQGWVRLIKRLEVDGVQVPVASSYQFDSTGEHVARIYISQFFEMPSMFDGVSSLQKIAFHTSPLVRIRLESTFYNCENLTDIEWGDSYIYCRDMYTMFAYCSKGLNVDVSHIRLLPPNGGIMNTSNAFNGAKVTEVVFGEVDKMSLRQTFWGFHTRAALIDFSRVKAITSTYDTFINADQPTVLDFGYCDLSGINIGNNTFLDFYNSNPSGTTIMLGKPYIYDSWKAKIFDLRGTLIYNLEHDYSDIIEVYYAATPQAYAPVEKTLRVRFCTNDAWVTDPSAEFVINGVRGAYVSQGIWVFGMTAETYKYPVFYNGTEIGEAIVKDDVQNIAFGTNSAVYKVIDFSTADSFDPSVIVANDGWAWQEYQQSSYFGLANNKIALGEKTSVTINTGMSGDIRLTLAQSSQTHYHFGKIYNSAGVLLKNMNGNGCQSFHIVGDVQSEDGILTFTYEKDGSSANGQDRMYIKKIESYNWPVIPAE